MPSTIFQVKGKHEKTTLITFVKIIPVDFTCLFGTSHQTIQRITETLFLIPVGARDGPEIFRISFDRHVDEITQISGGPKSWGAGFLLPRARSALAAKHLNS